jgi:hypothetical protein
VKARLRALWAKLFSWPVISHCLLILCLWALSAQVAYPTLDASMVMGWLNALILGLCVVVWALRLFLRPQATTESHLLRRSFVVVDVLVLLLIVYGVLLHLNGMLDSSAPETSSAVITEVVEDPFSPSWLLPAGRSVLTSSGPSVVITEILTNPRSPLWYFPAGRARITTSKGSEPPSYIALPRSTLAYLLIGQEVIFTQYQGFLGIRWITELHVDYQSVPQDLQTATDPIIKKDVTLSALHKQQWDRGLEGARQYASEEPEDIDFLFAVTEVLLKYGQAKPAVEFLQPIAETRPTYRMYYRYADVLYAMGDRDGSINALYRAVTMEAKPIEALYQLGYRLKGVGRVQEATRAFEALLAIQPGYPTVEHVLAELRQWPDMTRSSHLPSARSAQ